MISVTVDRRKVKELEKLLNGKAKRIKREMATAVNAAAKFAEKQSAKEISRELATSQKVIRKAIKLSRKAKASDTETKPKAVVTVKAESRIPLRDFGARQNKKGVTYKVSKTKGRKLAVGAFQGPRPGAIKASWRGRVFARVGKSRLPIVQLFGASPWGVFAKKKMSVPVMAYTKAELKKQVERRIRFIKLKQAGVI